MSAVPQSNVAAPSQPMPANGAEVPAPSGVNITGIRWRAAHVKSKDNEKNSPTFGKQKVVGYIVEPEFDEKNPEAGIQQIMNFPWSNDELNGGAGYRNAYEAIVKLVNTQHGTNLRNRMRQQFSGKTSAEEIKVKAFELMSSTPEGQSEMAAAMKQGGMALANLLDRYIKQVKDELNSKGNGDENDESDTPSVAGALPANV